MRVAVVTRYFPSSGEPAQGRSLYETLRIVSRSAEVRVFYPNAAYPRFLQPRSRSYDKLDLAFRPSDVSVSYFNYPALPLISRPLNGWMAARTLLPQVRAFAPDLVFGCFLYPEGYAALRIARSLGVPVAVMSIGSDLNRIGDSLSARHTWTVLREADAIVTVCEDTAQNGRGQRRPEPPRPGRFSMAAILRSSGRGIEARRESGWASIRPVRRWCTWGAWTSRRGFVSSSRPWRRCTSTGHACIATLWAVALIKAQSKRQFETAGRAVLCT